MRLKGYHALVCAIQAGLAVFILSCSGSDSGQPAREKGSETASTIVDDVGRRVSLGPPARRIVSLAPNATEILFSIGAGERIIGITEQCNFPPEASSIPKIGGFSFLNIERLIGLKPDLVILTSLEQDRFVKNLEELGLRAYVSFPRDFDQLFRSIESIGRLTGDSDGAKALVASLEADLAALREEVDRHYGEAARPRVYLEISSRPLMTIGDDSFVDALIEEAGGKNIALDIPRDYAVISSEVVIDRDPDVIFVCRSSTTREDVGRRLGWGRIRAVETDQVYDDLDEDMIMRPGPRSVQGAREIFERLRKAEERDDAVGGTG